MTSSGSDALRVHPEGDSTLLDVQQPDISVSNVGVRLPPFWPKNPRAWFCQVEAQFHLRRITSQSVQYYHVISCLPVELVDELSDLLIAPPPSDAYDNIKNAILRRTTDSESSRLHQLLNTEELGDRRPSQLLHRMRQMLGERPTEGHSALLRELFLQRLPLNMRIILAAAGDVSLDKLAEMADRMAEHVLPAVSSVASPSSATSTTEERLQYLTDAVHALQLSHQNRPRPASRSASRRRSSARSRSGRLRSPPASARPADLCWYHRTYAENARRCRSPCSWQGNAPAGR